jgi:maltokinase
MSGQAPRTTADPVVGRAVSEPAVVALLQRWAPLQRWFPAKGTRAALEPVAVVDLTDPLGEADVAVHLLRLPRGGVLQLPVVLRPDDGIERPGVIAALPDAGEDATGRGRLVVDGCQDAAFVRSWLAAAEHDVTVRPQLDGLTVMAGEQSNTSILLPEAGPPAILKVFRAVSPGPNPDVDVPLALARGGWDGVPRPMAWLSAAWPSATGLDVGHLGVLSELVVDAEDGFELACRYARHDEDFGALAQDLGATTAQMHAALRTALPVSEDDARCADGRGVVATLRERAAAAVAAVTPLLDARSVAIERVLAAVAQAGDLPHLQRVHGDFHLGQVLRSERRGWSVLDFEGEPQASAAERTRPDLALRDLAGMLRSMDYAGAVGGGSPEWVRSARAGLIQGYQRGAAPAAADLTDGATALLLRALELDKALYEVVYESRNRPAWVAIPLEGVDRLLSAGQPPG